MIDKQGRKPTSGCRIAIAEISLSGSFNYVPRMSFAVVKDIKKDSLSIKYSDGSVDSEFTNSEFIIIPGEVISLYSSLEQELYKVGVVNV